MATFCNIIVRTAALTTGTKLRRCRSWAQVAWARSPLYSTCDAVPAEAALCRQLLYVHDRPPGEGKSAIIDNQAPDRPSHQVIDILCFASGLL
jgi:hypothetical protein